MYNNIPVFHISMIYDNYPEVVDCNNNNNRMKNKITSKKIVKKVSLY